MIRFAFSPFLKFLSLSEKAQLAEIRKRLYPSGSGYDFHKSFRRLGRQLVLEGAPLDDMILKAGLIKREVERHSATNALSRLATWRGLHTSPTYPGFRVTYVSPNNLFTLTYEADFVLREAWGELSLHLWNNAAPKLAPQAVYAGLRLVESAPDRQDAPKCELGVLSIRDNKLFRLGEASLPRDLLDRYVDRVESLIDRTGPAPTVEERPTA